MTQYKTSLGIFSVIAIVGIATLAFAHGPGNGRNGGNMMGSDDGYGHMMDYGRGRGHHMMGYGNEAYGNLSRDDAVKLERARDEFYESTRSLRSDIREKQLALDKALDMESPDPKSLSNLQKELSTLESEFDQKALAYRLNVSKIQPENYRGSGNGSRDCWR